MKSLNISIIRKYIFVVFIYIFIWFCHLNIFTFNLETDETHSYLAVLLLFLGILINSAIQTYNSFNSDGNTKTILNLVLVLIISNYLFFSEVNFGNEYATYLFVFAILSLSYYKEDNQYKRLMLVGFVAGWFYEMWVGIIQLLDNFSAPTILMGTFQNSGIYAIYLVITLPLVFYFVLYQNKTIILYFRRKINSRISSYYILCFEYFLLTIFATFVITVLILNQSRTAIITLLGMFIVAILHLYFHKVKSYFWRFKGAIIAFLIISLTSLVYLGHHLFYLKEKSAIGRIFMIKVASAHFNEDIWFGCGPGTFTLVYPKWQAQYFANQSNIKFTDFISASETYIIFNEHFQILKTFGIVGLIFYLFLLFLIFIASSNEHKYLLLTCKVIVSGIIVSGFTSYPLHTNLILLLTFLCLVINVSHSDHRIYTKYFRIFDNVFSKRLSKLPMEFFIFLLCIYGIIIASQKYKAICDWDALKQQTYLTDANYHALEKISNYLSDDGKFLTEYGILEYEDGKQYKTAVNILERAKKKFISVKTVQATYYAYWKLRDYKNAIKNAIFLSNYIPSRFSFKYDLFRLYLESGDRTNAKKMAKIIAHMHVKVPSQKVNDIKAEVHKIALEIDR